MLRLQVFVNPPMGQMKPIQLPTIFNVATHFVDRHIAEGRGDRIAYECGDDVLPTGSSSNGSIARAMR